MEAVRADVDLTGYVADFIVSAKPSDLPDDVVALGKKSILDGLGLALSGAVAPSGALVRRHLDELNLGRRRGDGDRRRPQGRAALCRLRQRRRHPCRRLRRHPTRRCPRPRLRAADPPDGAGAAGGARDRRSLSAAPGATSCSPITSASRSSARSPKPSSRVITRPASTRQRPAALSRPPRPARRLLRARCRDDAARACHRRQPVGRPAREFRHDDKAVPCRARGGERRRGRAIRAFGWTATDMILEAPRGFFRAAGGGYDLNAIYRKARCALDVRAARASRSSRIRRAR